MDIEFESIAESKTTPTLPILGSRETKFESIAESKTTPTLQKAEHRGN